MGERERETARWGRENFPQFIWLVNISKISLSLKDVTLSLLLKCHYALGMSHLLCRVVMNWVVWNEHESSTVITGIRIVVRK